MRNSTEKIEELQRIRYELAKRLKIIDGMLLGHHNQKLDEVELPPDCYWLDAKIIAEALLTEGDATHRRWRAVNDELAKDGLDHPEPYPGHDDQY